MSLSTIFPTLRLLTSRSVVSASARPSSSLVRLFSVSSNILQNAAQSAKSETLFVGGLNFDTTQDGLREVFSKFDSFKDARIIERNGRSKGFGYVEFTNADSAETALKEMNEQDLDGFTLRVDFATPRAAVNNRPRNSPTEIVFLGNLPYTYGAADLEEVLTEALGGSIQGLKDIRLPGNPAYEDFPEGSVNKGFGFATFNDQESAIAFKDALQAKIEEGGFRLEGNKAPRLDFAQPMAPREFRERGSFSNDRRAGGRPGGYGGERRSGGYGNDRRSGGYGGQREVGGYDRQSRGGYGGERRPGGFRRSREDDDF